MVVGRLDAVGVGEGPEGGPAFEEVAGELPVVFGAWALAGGVLEQRCGAWSWSGAMRAWSAARSPSCWKLLPGGEQVVGDREAGVSEVLLFAHAFAVGGEVAEQVRPAELAAGRGRGSRSRASGPSRRSRRSARRAASCASEACRPAAIRNTAVRLVSAPQSVRRSPRGLPAGLVDVDDRASA